MFFQNSFLKICLQQLKLSDHVEINLGVQFYHKENNENL